MGHPSPSGASGRQGHSNGLTAVPRFPADATKTGRQRPGVDQLFPRGPGGPGNSSSGTGVGEPTESLLSSSTPVHSSPLGKLRKVGSMKIGIIGAGNIGGNLTRRLTALGHEVAVANSRGPHTLTALAEETGAKPVPASEAARGAQVVVVTVPLKAVPDLPDGFLDGAAEGAAVIDTGNYYPQQRDGRIAAIEDGLPESRWTERQIGHPVIKAFNGTYAQDILNRGRPQGTPGRQALPVAGDDPKAKQAVRDLIDELGFDTVDSGGLDESWRQQPGTPVYGSQGDVDAIVKALSEASQERTAEWRA
ncbi:NAD(P)-binding domain-containing protein [Streptomyces sp. CA-278952]|uniref:NADPH-dependent F420 reductase n=1 Tax=unclassified Streptomyces TaxID=2593676 RepID=UPI0023685AF9|nr:NAD(P)-binding domain-containing protein [Streptomyces sp. CA-278952]WDG26983.1 NAD(P)-binding domain-containing protein [Streptomyces sp. CA-278952]